MRRCQSSWSCSAVHQSAGMASTSSQWTMRTGASQTRMRTGAACSVILLAELVVAGLAGLAERSVLGADGAHVAAGRDRVELVRLARQALRGGFEFGGMGPDVGLG